MKASELIIELKKLIEKHGDQEVVAYCDHEIVNDVSFDNDSWINNNEPAFELE